MILRATAKVRTLLRVTNLPVVAPSHDDWYANLLWIDRRKCLLVTHAGTMFSVFAPSVTAGSLRPIGRFVVPLIQHALAAEGLPADALGSLDADDVIVAKTADRRILGTTNDLAFMCEVRIAGAGGIDLCDLAELNRFVRRTINSITGYVPPVDLVSDRVARASAEDTPIAGA